jgi:hypothetical protein
VNSLKLEVFLLKALLQLELGLSLLTDSLLFHIPLDAPVHSLCSPKEKLLAYHPTKTQIEYIPPCRFLEPSGQSRQWLQYPSLLRQGSTLMRET